MPSRTLRFDNDRGDTLAAVLDLPPDGEVIGCALFAHCFTCSKNLSAAAHVARALTAEGLAVLRFDFTGLGQSGGDFADTHVSTNVADLVAAARFMGEQLEAPSLLVGHSLGGAAVLLAAEHLPSVKAVATIGAPCRPDHVRHLLAESEDEIRREGEAEVILAGRRFTIREDFLDDLDQHRMDEAIGGLDRALLVLHAPTDQTVGVENAAHIFEHAKHPKSFVSLDTADHLLTDPADSRYAGSVIAAWASRYLGASQPERKRHTPDDNRIVARTEAGGFRTAIVANGHPLVADEPASVGGTNEGPSPYDLVAAGLAACTSMTLRMYADHKGWPLESATVRVLHEKVHATDATPDADADRKGGKLDRFTREIAVEGNLDEEQRARLVEIAERCPVHRTLHGAPEVITRLADAPTPHLTPETT
jgi:putative redox protein